MTSDAYQKLDFNMKCTSASLEANAESGLHEKKLQCAPDAAAADRSSHGLTPSDLLFNKLSTGMLLTDQDETSQFAGLLSSLMMNGLPLLGIDDFVHFSDFVNTHLGSKLTTKILSSPGYKEKFSNFLEVRTNHILFYPDNCWTREFILYLKSSSRVFKDLQYRIYGSKKAAMKHCCHNVWAVLQIRPTHGSSVSGSTSGGTSGGSGSRNSEWKCAVFDPLRWNKTALNMYPTHTSTINSTVPTNNDTSTTNIKTTTYTAPYTLHTPIPAVTIRMHPASIPDTRNFEHSPINRHINTRQQSGQLLYFTSGFLTLQLEVQNFLAFWELGGSIIQSDAFSGRNEGKDTGVLYLCAIDLI